MITGVLDTELVLRKAREHTRRVVDRRRFGIRVWVRQGSGFCRREVGGCSITGESAVVGVEGGGLMGPTVDEVVIDGGEGGGDESDGEECEGEEEEGGSEGRESCHL